MPINAQTIINRAFRDLGVTAQNENPSASEAIDALARLNEMVESWANQPLTIPCVNRAVFPVVSNQSTYTIGPGGDFDTVRPLSLQGAGLLQNAEPLTYTITDADTAANTLTIAGDQTAFFTPGAPFTVTGSTGNNGIYTVRSATFGTQTVIVPLEVVRDDTTDGTIAIATASSPVEIPIGVMTDDTYQSLVLKNLSGTMFTNVYLNQTYPLATIFLSPTPNTAINNLVLYLLQQLTEFAGLTTDYDFPQGYVSAFEWNLAEVLIPSYAVSSPLIVSMVTRNAMKYLANIKRTNTKPVDIVNDAAYLRGNRQGIYNIFSDTGG